MSAYPVSIIYNGVDAFYPQPTPFIALDEQTIYANEIWGRQENVTLQGNLTGCTYDKIVEAQRDLFARFSKPFQTLEVWQNLGGGTSGKIFQKELVEIQSIDINQGRWYGIQPYSINLTCYPSGLFSGMYGILNPSDNWSFDEQENATLSITHTISCQPFNTSSGPSNALDNARNWAFGRTGVNSWVYPVLISGVSPSNFCLLTQAESIDRFNGTYTLAETYTNDLARSGYGVIRYSTDISSGDNMIQVSLDGSAQGGSRNITGTRAALARIDMVAVALKQYQSAFNRTDLNPIPTAQSFNEDPFTSQIAFSYSFDNSSLPSVWFDYEVNMNVGTNGMIEASIGGTVYARGGDVASKLARTTAYASGVNLYNLVLPFYNDFDPSSVAPLNPVPVDSSKGINETNGTVSLSASYNNRAATDSVIDQFNASISITPSLAQVDAQPILGGLGSYSVVDLRYGSRGSISINGNAVINRNSSAAAGEAVVKSMAYALFSQYGNSSNATLDQSQTSISRTDDRVVNFNYVWSFGPVNIVGPTSLGSMAV